MNASTLIHSLGSTVRFGHHRIEEGADIMVAEPLDKCPLDGPLPDGTFQYVGRAYRGGYGKFCKPHDDRLRVYDDPYATPLPSNSKEPRWDINAHRRRPGDLNRNA